MNQETMFAPTTKNGYKLDEVASALQKDIRRGNEADALFWALELFPYYAKYCWRRLLVISVEDIEDPGVCAQIYGMYASWLANNEGKKAAEHVNRIFITKAVLTLTRATKSREADHAQFTVDARVDAKEFPPIPDYAYDVHTKQGRMKGKTKAQFITEEQEGLSPKGEDRYFDKLNK